MFVVLGRCHLTGVATVPEILYIILLVCSSATHYRRLGPPKTLIYTHIVSTKQKLENVVNLFPIGKMYDHIS